MRFEVDGNEVYASTGGRDHVDGQSYLIFLHGAGSSHLVWTQQSRSFAYGGYNVLALDLPGHNLSKGKPLAGVEAQADWVLRVMDHLDISGATLIGHSQGGLIALTVAHKSPERVQALGFIATAAAIPVNDALINLAGKAQPKAKSAMTSWGLGPQAHHFDNTVPGVTQVATGLRVMDRNDDEALPVDLVSCNTFEAGLEMATQVQCPSVCILAGKDRMTPIKFGKQLAGALPNNELHILANSGHTIPTEKPLEVNAILRAFLKESVAA